MSEEKVLKHPGVQLQLVGTDVCVADAVKTWMQALARAVRSTSKLWIDASYHGVRKSHQAIFVNAIKFGGTS